LNSTTTKRWLYDHQKVALEYLRLYEGFALFHEQGLGKTLVALTHIARLALAGEIESALVIAPKAAMGAWSRDIVKFPPAEQAVLERSAPCDQLRIGMAKG
jgi:SNF2 family DNA or RNA helicase